MLPSRQAVGISAGHGGSLSVGIVKGGGLKGPIH